MKHTEPNQLTFFAPEPPASHSHSPDSGAEYQTRVATSPSTFLAYLQKNAPRGWSGKTSRTSCPPGAMRRQIQRDEESGKQTILTPSSQGFAKSGIASHGEYWMLNTSVWPSDASVSSLSHILETTGDHLTPYFLTPRACQGILRRAANRGRQLPHLLRTVLEHVAQTTTRHKPDTSSPPQSRPNGQKESEAPQATNAKTSSSALSPSA